MVGPKQRIGLGLDHPGLAAVRRGQWWTAALALALPIFIKVWPIAVVLLLLVCWPRQLTGRLLAVCGALALVPFLTRPPDIVAWQYREWYATLVGPVRERWPGYRDAWTIWSSLRPCYNVKPTRSPIASRSWRHNC